MFGFDPLFMSSSVVIPVYRYLRLSWGNSIGWGANVGLSDVRFYVNGIGYPSNLTNNMLPSPYVASAATVYSDGGGTQYPYYAFDNNGTYTEYVAAGNGAGYLQLDFGLGFGINPDRVEIRGRNNNECPASPIILLGSNDGSTFDTLASFVYASWTPGVTKNFPTGLGGSAPRTAGTPIVYSTTSAALASFVAPSDGQVEFYTWGAAGGASWDALGGPGGYAYGRFVVKAGQVIKYGAGQSGVAGGNGNGPKIGGAGAGGYGNGGNGGTGTDNYSHGGSGAGASVGLIDNALKVVAGGGAGSGAEAAYRGGSGGGLIGGNGTNSATGGTQTAPGGNASGMDGGNGTAGREAGAGGGGGWKGGGGGSASFLGGGGTGAGGGAGYVAPDALDSATATAAFTATQPPNVANAYHNGVAGVPKSGTSNAGLTVAVFVPYVNRP